MFQNALSIIIVGSLARDMTYFWIFLIIAVFVIFIIPLLLLFFGANIIFFGANIIVKIIKILSLKRNSKKK